LNLVNALQQNPTLEHLSIIALPSHLGGLSQLLKHSQRLISLNVKLVPQRPTELKTKNPLITFFNTVQKNAYLKRLTLDNATNDGENTSADDKDPLFQALHHMIKYNLSLTHLNITFTYLFCAKPIPNAYLLPNLTLQSIDIKDFFSQSLANTSHKITPNEIEQFRYLYENTFYSTKTALNTLIKNKLEKINTLKFSTPKEKKQIKQDFFNNLKRWIERHDPSVKPTAQLSIPHKYSLDDGPGSTIREFLGAPRSPDNQTVNVLCKSCCQDGFFSIIKRAKEEENTTQLSCPIL